MSEAAEEKGDALLRCGRRATTGAAEDGCGAAAGEEAEWRPGTWWRAAARALGGGAAAWGVRPAAGGGGRDGGDAAAS